MDVKYIVVEGENDVKCESFEDVVKALVDERYYDMSEQARKDTLTRKAAANALNTRFLTNEKDLSEFVLDDEVTYVLSLLRQGTVYLLENANSRELTKGIDIPENGKNYVVVNNFADELLESYQKDNGAKNKSSKPEIESIIDRQPNSIEGREEEKESEDRAV